MLWDAVSMFLVPPVFCRMMPKGKGVPLTRIKELILAIGLFFSYLKFWVNIKKFF
jgi:hypothetical protein